VCERAMVALIVERWVVWLVVYVWTPSRLKIGGSVEDTYWA